MYKDYAQLFFYLSLIFIISWSRQENNIAYLVIVCFFKKKNYLTDNNRIKII